MSDLKQILTVNAGKASVKDLYFQIQKIIDLWKGKNNSHMLKCIEKYLVHINTIVKLINIVENKNIETDNEFGYNSSTINIIKKYICQPPISFVPFPDRETIRQEINKLNIEVLLSIICNRLEYALDKINKAEILINVISDLNKNLKSLINDLEIISNDYITVNGEHKLLAQVSIYMQLDTPSGFITVPTIKL